jgi:hypothetical protein
MVTRSGRDAKTELANEGAMPSTANSNRDNNTTHSLS